MNYRESFAPNIVLIAVDCYHEKDFSGRIYTKYDKEPIRFASSLEMILKLEERYDDWAFPENAVIYRDFKSRRGPKPAHPERKAKISKGKRIFELSHGGSLPEEEGKIATVVLECRQRLHADWTGIFWLDQEEDSHPFSSTLELMKYMDDYISAKPRQAGALWAGNSIV